MKTITVILIVLFSFFVANCEKEEVCWECEKSAIYPDHETEWRHIGTYILYDMSDEEIKLYESENSDTIEWGWTIYVKMECKRK